MRYLSVASLLPLAAILGACSSYGVTSAPTAAPTQAVSVSLSPTEPRETILLVSLDDGSVIKQTISSNADLCFKSSLASATTCLTQGAPVIDPVSNAVIGFEMVEDHIDLVAKSTEDL